MRVITSFSLLAGAGVGSLLCGPPVHIDRGGVNATTFAISGRSARGLSPRRRSRSPAREHPTPSIRRRDRRAVEDST